MKKGIYSWFGYALPFEERIKLIKSAGFDSVMLWWGDDNVAINGLKINQPAIVASCGLAIENAHLPFSGINVLWEDTTDGDVYESNIKNAIKECSQYGIKTVIMHITNGFKLPNLSNIMLDRIRRIAVVAKEHNVKLALENLKVVPALDFILANIKDENVGFCYDSGHHNCFASDIDLLGKYGNRLFAIHLHDNFGETDMHMLPYDGNIDWEKVYDGIKKSNYHGALTLELEASKYHPYDDLSAEEYLAKAYQCLVKLDKQ